MRVNYHLPAEVVRRVDRYAAKLAAEDPIGRPVTRADAMRLLLIRALDSLDKK